MPVGRGNGVPAGLVLASALAAWAGVLAAASSWTQEAGGSRLNVIAEPRLAESPVWRPWIETSVEAVAGVSGRLPFPEVAVVLEASDSGGPVRFGRVVRSQPPRVHLYVHPEAAYEDLAGDWRGYHEFAHLLLPYPGNRDIWFSEGLASYYQYLLMARAGVVEPDQAWRDLMDGFQRGFDDPAGRGESLRELSPGMWRERAFRRVYWTGAAYFLRVDVRLRTETGGRHSLDSALAAFQDCCMHARRRWSAVDLIERLGELSVPEIWQEEYARMIDAPARPVFDDALDRLGIRGPNPGLARLSGEPRAVALRRAIAAPGTD